MSVTLKWSLYSSEAFVEFIKPDQVTPSPNEYIREASGLPNPDIGIDVSDLSALSNIIVDGKVLLCLHKFVANVSSRSQKARFFLLPKLSYRANQSCITWTTVWAFHTLRLYLRNVKCSIFSASRRQRIKTVSHLEKKSFWKIRNWIDPVNIHECHLFVSFKLLALALILELLSLAKRMNIFISSVVSKCFR